MNDKLAETAFYLRQFSGFHKLQNETVVGLGCQFKARLRAENPN
jgi:hypothetical protein